MRSIFVLMFAAVAMLAMTAFSVRVSAQGCTPTWAAGGLEPLTDIRSFGVYFPANGRFYSMGGREDDNAGSDHLNPFEYNPATNTWVTKSAVYPDNQVNNMACGLLTAGTTPLIYCVGGSEAGAPTGSPRATRVFTYNPVTDTIAILPAADNWPGGTMNLPGGGAVLNNRLYTIGGFTGAGMIEGVWEFNPNAASGSRWTTKASLPVQRGYVPAVGLGGFIYSIGGAAWNGTTLQDSTESFKYDPVANTWTAIAPIPRATGETRAVVINNQVWVLGGGRTAPNPSNEVDVYDPASNTWSLGPPFMLARRNFPADSDGGVRIWIAGGYTATTIEDTTEFFVGCPLGASPTPTPPPATPTPTPASPTPTPASPTPTPASPTPSPSASPSPPTRTLFDFDGDRHADISVTRPDANWVWYQALGPNYTFTQTQFGQAGDVVAPADFDGDTITDIAIFRGSTGEWWYRGSSDGLAHRVLSGASVGDVPRPGDVNGDGFADFVNVHTTGQGMVWIRLINGSFTHSDVAFGLPGDQPLLADFDGDGRVDPAIFRPSTGTFWYAASASGGVHTAVRWGIAGDVPVPADYDGDGTTDFAVYRPSDRFWYILNSRDGSATFVQFGLSDDKPIPADYDGDRRADIAVYRPSTGTWYLLRSTAGFGGFQFGVSTDIPSPGAYLPEYQP